MVKHFLLKRVIEREKTHKVWKSGNSPLTKTPPQIERLLDTEDGDHIAFKVTSTDQVRIDKAKDIDQSIEGVRRQYRGMLEKLTDM